MAMSVVALEVLWAAIEALVQTRPLCLVVLHCELLPVVLEAISNPVDLDLLLVVWLVHVLVVQDGACDK